jgi:gamma-glutamylcysteine synthetase
METEQIRRHVAPLFTRGAAPSTRVGVEHELVAADLETGDVVPVERIRRATRHAAYASHLAFEPGGQVELSVPCVATGDALAHRLAAEVAALRADCAAVGVRIDAVPVDPRPADAVPLQLTTPRYVAMQAHFDAIGPAGRRMMRRTASTQVCLDWWPGAAGREQWRLLNLAAPYLAAAFARSVGPESRLATWLMVDPGRTAFDDRLLHGADPVAAYADFAACAAVFTAPGDVVDHLTTLFPPIRPRGSYLEVRFLDVQRTRDVATVVAVLAALMYDDGLRRRTLRRLGGGEHGLAHLWQAAAEGAEEVHASGRALADEALSATGGRWAA